MLLTYSYYINLDRKSDDKENFECVLSGKYFLCEMYFLINPKKYKFIHSVSLRKCATDLKVSEISKQDQDALNDLISKIHPEIPLIQDQTSLKSRQCMFFDYFGELTHSPIVTGRRWMINITITGYKIYKNETFSPIWKVSNAIDARCKNLDVANCCC